MQKYLLTFLAVVMLCASSIVAQDQVWVPYLSFRLDDNPTDQYFLEVEGQLAGEHRFSDASNLLQYKFDLSLLEDFHNEKPLTLRFDVKNEYLVKISDVAITDRSEGEVVAQYSDDPDNESVRDGENKITLEIPLQDYFDLAWPEIYLSFFDHRPQDGWGPSIENIGFYYQEDPANIADNSVEVVIGDLDAIYVDGDVSDWNESTEMITLTSGADGIFTDGTITDDNDLSAITAVSFDTENLYFSAMVNDDQVVDGQDALVFYFGVYDVTAELQNKGHRALPAAELSGYRTRLEADYRFEVLIDEANAVVNETKIVEGTPEGSEVSVVKTSTGYAVEAKVPFNGMFVPLVNTRIFEIDESQYLPFAFKVIDKDASDEGVLITGTDSDVDDNPVSWGLKTFLLDKQSAGGNEEVARKVLKEIIPGGNDEDYFVPEYPGSGSDEFHRWADGQDTLGFKFDIAAIEAMQPGQEIIVDFFVGNEYVLETSGSLHGEREVHAVWASNGAPVHDMSNSGYVSVSLKEMREKGYFELYTFFSDGIPTDGWGPSVSKIRFYYAGVYENTILFEFTPGNGANGDADYLVDDNGSGADENHRWTDGTNYFGYQFNLNEISSQIPEDSEPFFNVFIQNEWIIEAATTVGGEKVVVKTWSDRGLPVHDGSNAGWQNIPLQPYIDAGLESVIFYFSDGISTDGWGGSLFKANVDYREILAYVELDTFIPDGGIAEAKYLVPGYEGSGVDETHRWADGYSEVAYSFSAASLLGQTNGSTNIVVRVDIQNEYVIEAAPHVDSARTFLLTWSEDLIPEHGGNNATTLEISLKEFFDAGWEDAIIFFRDGIPTDGWGPSISNVSISGLEKLITDIEVADVNIPLDFELEQNYPNPFNPTTVINYTVPSAGMVKLTVYNILGQQIKTLVQTNHSAGRYSVSWSGENNYGRKVASGIYLYQIEFNKQNISKKMILMK